MRFIEIALRSFSEVLLVNMVVAPAASMPKGMGQQPKSLLGGVFTSGQASEGEMTFQRVCVSVSCHDADEFKWLSNW